MAKVKSCFNYSVQIWIVATTIQLNMSRKQIVITMPAKHESLVFASGSLVCCSSASSKALTMLACTDSRLLCSWAWVHQVIQVHVTGDWVQWYYHYDSIVQCVLAVSHVISKVPVCLLAMRACCGYSCLCAGILFRRILIHHSAYYWGQIEYEQNIQYSPSEECIMWLKSLSV